MKGIKRLRKTVSGETGYDERLTLMCIKHAWNARDAFERHASKKNLSFKDEKEKAVE
jgi:hypothetical protein